MRLLRPASVLLFLLALVLFVAGCSGELLGTNDAELEYTVDAPSPPPPEAMRSAVRARLGAAQVSADVDPVGAERVRIVSDADSIDTIDDLVRWKGGLAFYRIDPAFFFSPEDPTGLHLVTAPLADGGTERYFAGPIDDVRRAVAAAKPPTDHSVFLERIDAKTARTRVVFAPAVAEVSDGNALQAVDTTDYGRAVAVTFTPAALAKVEEELAPYRGARVAVVRGHALLDVRPVEEINHSPLILSFGKDIYAYTRAHHTAELLRTGPLPPMTRVRAERLPEDWPLAVASVALPVLLSFAWLFFVRQFDRARPEPMWLVLATFALGGLSVIPAGLVEYGCMRLTPFLDPSLMTFGGQLASFPVALVVFTLVVGGAEEGGKLLGAWSLACHRHEFDEPVDGIVYGCASALGFAAVENVKYFAIGRLSGVLIATRTFMSVPAHMFFGAIWGYALGKRLVSKRTSVLLFFALAALAHGAFDTFLSVDPLQILAVVLNLVLALTFLFLLRKALRHGSVSDDFVRAFTFGADDREEPPASRDRVFFRMGSRTVFVTCAAAMVALGFGIVVLGGAYEILHRRVGIVFVVLASGLLGLFGVAAWGLTQTIPLDAVVDQQGLTYAGMLTPWSALLGMRGWTARSVLFGTRAWLEVRTARGDVKLGPATPEVMRRLAGMLGGRSLSD